MCGAFARLGPRTLKLGVREQTEKIRGPTEKRKRLSFAKTNSKHLAAVEETLQTPSPPYISNDYDFHENNGMVHVVEKAGVEHKQIYATKDVTDFSDKLYSWMRRTAEDVKNGHVELVRGKLVE
ncbi:hypothetical protein BWQ96_06657 [Gracilariopsis chorda]|uniref:Uncharacterized protein n=1 Tax=Gracilariopsis chorda TaxID=448386 RepID=A0A2V3IR16_9FLOR|nr:hypothetical protein BWQ96_06657 [Gracilariopsis chorda]|eukprot:PXF43600.1 hypothetical protein BWQ96_06657 [Gracilariopsis chorda]